MMDNMTWIVFIMMMHRIVNGNVVAAGHDPQCRVRRSTVHSDREEAVAVAVHNERADGNDP